MADALSPAGLSPAPILERFEAYRGRVVDLDRGETVDGDGLRRRRDRLAAGLAAAGVAAGERVVLAVGNGPLFPAALAAVLAAGACPLLAHGATPRPELLRLAATWTASWLLADDPALAAGDAPGAWRPCGGDGPILRAAAAGAPGERLVAVPLHPTSGTTGRPKMALRPGAAAIAEAAHYAAAMRIEASDRILCAVPMSHAYGYGTAVTVPLLTGADVLAMRAFAPKLVRRALAEGGVTIFPAVPAMLPVLLRGRHWPDGAGPRLLLTAGAPLPPETARAFRAATGVRPRPLFGTTETGGVSVAVGEVRPGAVGPAMAGVEVRVRAAGRLGSEGAGPDGAGPLEVRSASMMAGYLTAEGPRPGVDAAGWLATGDLARLAADGQIELLGRESDLIDVMGHKVLPAEVEAVIAALPEVAEVAVYAGRHRTGADTVLAAVVPNGPLAAETVLRHCERQLVAHKRPSRVVLLDALPRTPSGKIVRRDLPQARAAPAAPRPPGAGP